MRDALIVTEGRALVRGQIPRIRDVPELVALTALLGEATSTLVVRSSVLRPGNLDPEGLIDIANDAS